MIEAARRATVSDLASLRALAQELRHELIDTRGGAVWASDRPTERDYSVALEAALHADDREVVVGTLDGEVVGYALCRVRVLADARRLGVIDDLFVTAAARSVGIGEAMSDAIGSWCAEARCFGIDATALPGNRAAKNFFETHGYVARLIVMHKPINPQS